MTTEPTEYVCIKENVLTEQGKQIAKLDAELGYKKERLDEIKEDTKRMEAKIDENTKLLNELVLESTKDDEKLNNRITAIETRQKVQDEMIEKNRADNNLKLYIVIVIFAVLTFYFNFIHHIS